MLSFNFEPFNKMLNAPEKLAVVSLGSNMGNREEYLSLAIKHLNSMPGTRLLKKSSVIETEPVDVPEEFVDLKFLNQVALFATTLQPMEFSRRMHLIEDLLDRVRIKRNGPRTIDIDLIDFDGIVMNDPILTLPHPRAHEREFVIKPLHELMAL